MNEVFSKWFRKYFSDPEGVTFAVLLIVAFATVIFFGNMLAPVIASIVISFLLEGLVAALERRQFKRLFATLIVYIPFIGLVLLIIFGLFPLISNQLTQLIQELPSMIVSGQQALLKLPELYPSFITGSQVDEIISSISGLVTQLGKSVVSLSLASITGLVTVLVYLILVPVLVFFFLKDKRKIISWFSNILPKERKLAIKVWREMDSQIGNYVRGKFAEIVIVGLVTYIVFIIMGLEFAILLGVLVGLSVIIPYIGAAVVTVPVFLIAFYQWGWSSELAYLLGAYAVIQALDGNVLVPLLFSEAVNLHPIAIIVAVLVFGGIWGFWGVFFAIPLATLFMAVFHSWPRMGETAKSDIA